MPRHASSPRAPQRFVPSPPPGARAGRATGATRSTPAAAAAAERIRVVIHKAKRKLEDSRRKLQSSVTTARNKLTSRQ